MIKIFLPMALTFLTACVRSAVLGIDFGGEFYKISLIKSGKAFDLVENLYSKSRTHNILGFFDNMRLKESEAYNKVIRVPHNSFYFFSKYIGQDINDPILQKMRIKHFDDYSIVDSESGDTLFEIKEFVLPVLSEDDEVIERLDKQTKLKLEEIFGMILEHARILSEIHSKIEIKDCFVSVPPWWGPKERKVFYSSLKLAGFVPLGFASENTGTATYHAINRKTTSPNETILFFNIGSTSTKASIFKFENIVDEKNKTRETFHLVAEAWDREAGGYSMDI